jgi:hypothetical protein
MTAIGQEEVSKIFQVIVTFELTLFTFCPPEPDDLANENSNSEKGILIMSIVVIMIA